MSKLYKVGMYGGKFIPFHKGHKLCLDVASSECEKVYLILFSGGDQESEILKNNTNEEYLQLEDRQKKIKKLVEQYDNVEFITLDISKCRKEDGTEDWDAETPLVLNACGELDAVYGSEYSYADYFKRAYPRAIYRLVDPPRKIVPISATKIRNMKEKERGIWTI